MTSPWANSLPSSLGKHNPPGTLDPTHHHSHPQVETGGLGVKGWGCKTHHIKGVFLSVLGSFEWNRTIYIVWIIKYLENNFRDLSSHCSLVHFYNSSHLYRKDRLGRAGPVCHSRQAGLMWLTQRISPANWAASLGFKPQKAEAAVKRDPKNEVMKWI